MTSQDRVEMCFACRSTFMVEPVPQSNTAITCCSMEHADGRKCGRKYWHAKAGNDIRQGIDPAWLERP